LDIFDQITQEEAALAVRSVQDRGAFATLYDRYFPRVYNYLRFRCDDPGLVDDLTALVFERALTRIHTYSPQTAPFGAWLFAIARHALSDHWRAQRLRSFLYLDDLHREVVDRSNPEEGFILGEQRRALLAAVARLNDRERDLVGLKFAAGLNNRQIAKLTGLSESNVGVILFRAMGHMRTLLREPGVLGEEMGYG
jgi:RNA polymerase sigma-70 factor (ECF subfamily)